MADEKRDFKGIWIPKNVWLDKRITATEKMILMEIDSLDCEEHGCYASNEYLADMCGCSVSMVSKAISHLISLDYVCLASFDGRLRILRSRLVNFTMQTSRFYEQSNIVERYSREETNNYVYSSKDTTNINILTKNEKSQENDDKSETSKADENFERLWKMLPSTQYDRKSSVSKKRKKELLKMGEEADKAISVYLNTVNRKYLYKRDRFFNEIIDNYIGKTETDFADCSTAGTKKTKSSLQECYSALDEWVKNGGE